MRLLSAILLFGSAAYSQTAAMSETRIWIHVNSGKLLIPPGGKLKIYTEGAVSIQGGPGEFFSYSLRQKVRAHSEAEAQRLFQEFSLRTLRQGEWTILAARHAKGDDVEAELTITAPRTLKQSYFETRGGPVAIADLDGPVQVESAGGKIRMDRLGSSVSARTGGGDMEIGQVRGSLKCLSGAGSIHVQTVGGASWLETAGGEISVQESNAEVHAATAGGTVYVARAAGSVSARTLGGRIDVERAGGWVIAENSGGPIQVGSAKGVRCESASGAIRLRSVSGSLRAATGAGSIVAQLGAPGGMEDSCLNTGNGDITVFIPARLGLTIQAQNETGAQLRNIISDFAEIQVKVFRLRPSLAEGAINGGGPTLKLAAAGGTIYLRRLP